MICELQNWMEKQISVAIHVIYEPVSETGIRQFIATLVCFVLFVCIAEPISKLLTPLVRPIIEKKFYCKKKK